MYQRRRACETFIRDHQTLLHWTRRLPSELLSDIFFWCTDDNTSIPWNVSQVCHRWRKVALHIPRLWRKIPVIGRRPRLTLAAERRLFAFLSQDYLLRSGEESIIFSWNPFYKLANQFYSLFLCHAERWGDVNLTIDFVQIRFDDLEGRLPLLYALRLIALLSLPPDISLQAFKSAPRLKYLVTSDSNNLFVSDHAQLLHGWPWRQVTHLDTHLTTPDALTVASLDGFDHLVFIRLEWSFWPWIFPTVHHQVIFRLCKHLHIQIRRPKGALNVSADSTNFLKLMHFPVLEDLFICYFPSAYDEWVVVELEIFIRRHATRHLRSLHWHKEAAYRPLPSELGAICVEKSIFNRMAHLSALLLTTPSRDLLKHVLTGLGTDEDFMVGLQKLHFTVNARDFQDFEIQWITQGLRKIADSGREFDEVCLRMSPSSSVNDAPAIQPWEIVFKLDGWEAQLLDDSKQKGVVALENQLGNLPLAPQRKGIAHNVTKMGFQAARLRRSLIKFMHSREVAAISCREPKQYPPAIKEEILQRWVKMFIEKAETRRWTIAGDHIIVYVPSHSPLRKQESRWILGISDYDPFKSDFLDHDQVPGLNPTWISTDRA
ncbi:hypothetical protein AN958_06983 [Leucoagaricus sp. SymC.cos]|nr:hypothetical protein AN958_06983 [Leucoagaricus sp. SymC.cos]